MKSDVGKKRSRLWLLVLLILCLSGVQSLNAQLYFSVRYPDGSIRSKSTDDIRKLTFSNENNTCNIYINDGTVVTQSIDSMSFVFSQNETGSPLPVELENFSSTVRAGQVILKWNTATEVNSSSFVIEHYYLNNWTAIGEVNAAGNSNTPKQYEFVHAPTGLLQRYRLKIVDTDGSFTYSAELVVNMGIPREFMVHQNYPNPFNPSTTIAYEIPSFERVQISVYNILGAKTKELLDALSEPGRYTVVWDGTNSNGAQVSSGVYFLRVSAGKQIMQKKMLFVK